MRGLLSKLNAAAAAVLTAAAVLVSPAAAAETLTLTGVMTGADHQTYREVPFRVPAGTSAITVEFAHTGKDQKSVIDLGIRDPARFRGWSGGNKSTFTLAEAWATPSYLPGPLPAGEWKLILGVPNLRQDARAEYTAKITLSDTAAFHGFAEAPLKAGPAWYRGDLHLHTQHSDGGCPSRTGKRIPCPAFKTLEAAAGRGLDFVAVTDHNTSSHFQDLAELSAYYDDQLVIPGREVTTFHGHANVFGMTAPLDFQLGSARAPDLGRILAQVEAAGGLISLNHPGQPSGEACMGCGWTAKTDFARIPAIEAINGVNATGPLSGIPFWEKRLNDGHRITAVGGSDNHDASLTGLRSVGVPTTVVRAENLSQDAILAGIRAGHVFVDTQGTRDRLLEVTAQAAGAKAEMGDVLPTPKDALVRLHIRVKGAAGGKVVLRSDEPKFVPPNPISVEGDDATVDVAFGVDGKRHWVRVDVTGPDGALWLLGNPVYLRKP
ncbi:MAG TPA: CehA/McbA family metallohydrolase [Phenylobacterium sp.]